VPADNAQHLAFIGKVAGQVEAEYQSLVRRSGGITPLGLQEFVGRYLGALNHGTNRQKADQLAAYGTRWGEVWANQNEPGAPSVEEYLAEMVLFLMQLAHERAFDLYAASTELYEEWLENAQVVADNQARLGSQDTDRLRAETEGRA
jgi:hypothetical protein